MPYVPDSILDSTKKVLGIDSGYDAFDVDILMHINSVLSQLSQIGLGPDGGFEIEDSSTLWVEYLGANKNLNFVKTYVYLKVRMFFDPPTTSFDLTAKQDQIKELEFRINVVVDSEISLPDGTSYSAGAFMWELEAPNRFPPEAKSGDLGIYIPTKDVWRKS